MMQQLYVSAKHQQQALSEDVLRLLKAYPDRMFALRDLLGMLRPGVKKERLASTMHKLAHKRGLIEVEPCVLRVPQGLRRVNLYRWKGA